MATKNHSLLKSLDVRIVELFREDPLNLTMACARDALHALTGVEVGNDGG